MHELRKGRLCARRAVTDPDLLSAQRLRHLCFRGVDGIDSDSFDATAQHWLIEDQQGALLACFRLIPVTTPEHLAASYSDRFFDLAPMADLAFPMLELGRFCIRPDVADPDVLRLAWGALAGVVDDLGAGVLFGCTSFRGADPARHRPALSALAGAHLGPAAHRPQARGDAVPLPPGPPADPRAALAGLPTLLRTYLGMGGWVADRAVPDPDLDTLVVFTAVEIAAIPPARARALRAIASAENFAAA
ncbi:GNAT family N-acetyltransferase [Neotabrizicola shimadae]|uniref:L-ornithine N(alpha)-acyltransferase n=2 Tax=Neotabrizicola shimadae TaxID=2807096 RepID=A0A8G0ZZC6_9RHOB|nr:GNAT family N-acetyltransferase [Neotabrizicola shimadae]